ncbi:hypothetical protein [Azotobacter chroococcum]|uniref:hypothetical protein n=1 Tax=Azotobacter chroococcum TaxID=353 RepID=UPI00201D9DF4|nr:hypothetical protein [Azotobacter chroococcum]
MTLTVAMSDAEIRRQAARPEVGRLRAAQHPALRLRFLEERTRGSWDVRAAGEWKRFAGWPELNTKAALAVLPEVLARLAAGGGSGLLVNGGRAAGVVPGAGDA